jgi:hypothetical protein
MTITDNALYIISDLSSRMFQKRCMHCMNQLDVSASRSVYVSQLQPARLYFQQSLQLCHHKAPPTTGSEFQLAKINKRWLQWLGCCIFLHAHGENFMMFAEKKLGHVYLLKQGLDWSISQHCSWFAAWPGSWLQEFHHNNICSDV